VNCEECQQNLIDHVHEELEPPVHKSISIHLAQCSDCALEFCRLRADVEGIARAYEETPAPQTADRLRRRVERHFAPPWWRRLARALKQPVPVYAAAAAAAVPMLVWLAAESTGGTTNDTRPTVERPAAIDHYDATTPLQDPRIL
jgi:anti-sigma factor RsiW